MDSVKEDECTSGECQYTEDGEVILCEDCSDTIITLEDLTTVS